MSPYDVKREHKDLYAPKNREWALLEVPPQQFIAVSGKGNPNTVPAYPQAVAALYAVAYTLKFASKRAGRDFVVGPLEGLWWAPDPEVFTARAKDEWQWRMLISQPDWLTAADIKDATETALASKKLPAIEQVEHETLHEGRCAQVLHVGSYDDETPIMTALHTEYLPANGLTERDRHHEVYLGDPRRTAPEKLRTVLRQPVRPRQI
ncbi:GyrI-like domain-containing protein [Actinophytocola glycyrrhizae]|uniref:GyrI-like domain-containing protein n=1 Tax=Actinophytocola glycyrrhizae TaxID=2044873 RepID=A0ABV9RRN4_9PSEU